jgi:chitinase
VHPNDTVNFLAFLQELRNTTIGKNLVLSAATLDTPWLDSNGSVSTDLSAFNEVLDFIAIMNYDVRSNPSIGAGPSSPLDDSCAPPEARSGSAMSAVKMWTAAGMPAHQIVLGVPAYGHSFVLTSAPAVNTSKTNGSAPDVTLPAYPQYMPNVERRGDRWDSDGGLDVCGNMTGPGGTFDYWGLVEEGFLNEDGTPAEGVQYRLDNCSQTVRDFVHF